MDNSLFWECVEVKTGKATKYEVYNKLAVKPILVFNKKTDAINLVNEHNKTIKKCLKRKTTIKIG